MYQKVKKHLSIKTKMVIFVSITVVLAVTSVSVSFIKLHNRSLEQEFNLRINTIAASAADSLELPMLITNYEDIQRVADRLLRTSDLIAIHVVNDKSEVIFKKDKNKFVQNSIWVTFPITSSTALPSDEGMEEFQPREPLTKSETLGYLKAQFSKDKFQKQLNTMYQYMLSLTLIFIVLALIGGYLLISAIIGPVITLARVSNEIAHGNLHKRVTVKTHDELGELATSFNDMVEALEDSTRSLQQINDKLRQSNEDLDQFAYVVSHDLGAPLRRISDFSRILSRDLGEDIDDRTKQLLKRISTAAKDGQEMMDGLLELSRVKTRAKPFTKVNLTTQIQKVIRDFEEQIAKTKATINFKPLPTIDADEIQITQLFQNLISNALKYRKDDIAPIITITNQIDNNNVMIEITDNGIGFDQKHEKEIFQVFKRLHKSQSHYPGNGVGLSICDRIVKRLNGHISVRSTPGVGTTFSLRLPLKQELHEEVQQ